MPSRSLAVIWARTVRVAYLFEKTGLLCYPPGADEDKIMEAAIEAGASDVVSQDDGSLDVLSDPADFDEVASAMKSVGLEPQQAEVTLRASTNATLEVKQAETLLKLLDTLDDLDDVQQVYSNADIPDELLEESA